MKLATKPLKHIILIAYWSPAQPEHFGTEFLSHKMSIKTVADLGGALDHIAQYSSQHSEAIIAEDAKVIDTFMKSVDAAAVYANTSTAFTDAGRSLAWVPRLVSVLKSCTPAGPHGPSGTHQL